VPAFLAAVEHARRGQRAVRLTLRLNARSGDWIEVTVVLATIAPGDPPPPTLPRSRETRLEAHMVRIADGQRVSAIAADLYVSQSTVRNHLSSIYAKLGVHSQVDLIRLVRGGSRRPAADR
jgi:DNA-binding NarL/FixJ family response regulator